MRYTIEAGCGFVTLIAPPGTGKTTLLFQLLDRLGESIRTAYLFHTQCTSQELLRCVLADLGEEASERDTVALHAKLNMLLVAEAGRGKRVVLVVDEAQNLNASVLETIRLLSNFQTPSHKLIQIVLSGTTELSLRLSSPESLQLRDRISSALTLRPLSESEVREYVKHRMKIAGHQGMFPFTPGALDMIASASGGIPRRINSLCFRAMAFGHATRCRHIDESVMGRFVPGHAVTEAEPLRPIVLKKRRVSGTRIAGSVSLAVLATSLSFSPRPPQPAPARSPVAAAVSSSPEYLTVTVGRNETLGQLSRKHLGRDLDAGTINEILRLNPGIRNPNVIRYGARIRIPFVNKSNNLPDASTQASK